REGRSTRVAWTTIRNPIHVCALSGTPHPSPFECAAHVRGRHLLPQGEKGETAPTISPIAGSGDLQARRGSAPPCPLVGEGVEAKPRRMRGVGKRQPVHVCANCQSVTPELGVAAGIRQHLYGGDGWHIHCQRTPKCCNLAASPSLKKSGPLEE